MPYGPVQEGLASAMKAAVYYETGSPDVLRYEDVADPVCHASGVVIRVEAVSIEGGDTLNRGGGLHCQASITGGERHCGTIAPSRTPNAQ